MKNKSTITLKKQPFDSIGEAFEHLRNFSDGFTAGRITDKDEPAFYSGAVSALTILLQNGDIHPDVKRLLDEAIGRIDKGAEKEGGNTKH